MADVRLPVAAEFIPGQLAAIPWGEAVAAVPDGVDRVTTSVLMRLSARMAGDGSITVPFASTLVVGTR